MNEPSLCSLSVLCVSVVDPPARDATSLASSPPATTPLAAPAASV